MDADKNCDLNCRANRSLVFVKSLCDLGKRKR